jgi:hypothetical protein
VAQSARAQSRDITWPTDGCWGVAESRRVDLQRTRELQFKPILTFKETRSHVATSSRAADSGNAHPPVAGSGQGPHCQLASATDDTGPWSLKARVVPPAAATHGRLARWWPAVGIPSGVRSE